MKPAPSARVMFHATIHSGAKQPFRLSGRVAPYDLQLLREHVLARRVRGTRVELCLAPALQSVVVAALGDLGRRGIELVVRG